MIMEADTYDLYIFDLLPYSLCSLYHVAHRNNLHSKQLPRHKKYN